MCKYLWNTVINNIVKYHGTKVCAKISSELKNLNHPEESVKNQIAYVCLTILEYLNPWVILVLRIVWNASKMLFMLEILTNLLLKQEEAYTTITTINLPWHYPLIPVLLSTWFLSPFLLLLLGSLPTRSNFSSIFSWLWVIFWLRRLCCYNRMDYRRSSFIWLNTKF